MVSRLQGYVTEKLKKQKRNYSILQLFWIIYAMFAVAPLVFGLRAESILGLAVTGASLGFIGLSFSMYAQFRVYEAEVGFELRLREALAVKTNP